MNREALYAFLRSLLATLAAGIVLWLLALLSAHAPAFHP